MSSGVDFEELGRADIPGTRSYSLRSRHVDQTFQIDVARPVRDPGGRKVSTVYVLDGNGTFGIAAQTARLLQDDGLPPMIVVGIGYRFDKARELRAQFFETRTRDYTPSVDEPWLAETKDALIRQQGVVVDRATTGGAAAFLAFIEEELKPFIASRYPADPDDTVLTGASLGGLFTLYALFEKPGSFARYGAFSPSLWWDDRLLLGSEARLAERVKDLPVRLFLSVGVLEEGAGPPFQMVSNLETLRRTLAGRGYPNLRMTHQVFPDETHMSVYPASFSRGLRTLFA